MIYWTRSKRKCKLASFFFILSYLIPVRKKTWHRSVVITGASLLLFIRCSEKWSVGPASCWLAISRYLPLPLRQPLACNLCFHTLKALCSKQRVAVCSKFSAFSPLTAVHWLINRSADKLSAPSRPPQVLEQKNYKRGMKELSLDLRCELNYTAAQHETRDPHSPSIW